MLGFSHQRGWGAEPKKNPANKRDDGYRIWSNVEGTIRVEARFVAVANGQVELLRRNGEKLSIKMDDLSSDDREFAKSQQSLQLFKEAKGLFRKPPKLRPVLPAVILASHPDVRRRLGLLAPDGRTPSGRESDLLAIVRQWLDSPRRELLAGNLANGLRWEDRVEMLFREADAYEAQVEEVLSVDLTRELRLIGRTTFAPLVIQPTAWSYLQLPGIDEDLGLSPEQRANIDALKPEAADEKGSRLVLALLTKEQQERLDQVRWQLDPFLELASNPKALQKVRIPSAKRDELRLARYDLGQRVLARIVQGSLVPSEVGLENLSRRYVLEAADTFQGTLAPEQRVRLKNVLGETFLPWSERNPFTAADSQTSGKPMAVVEE